MRAKSLALLALALGCGLIASIGITQVMATRNGDPAPQAETISIVVATKDVGLGDVLSPQVLRLEPWPKDKAPASALTNIENIDGRRTRTRLYQGEPILENKLFAKGAVNNSSGLIPKGYRVVAVKVDMVSGSGLILPGDRVDVFVYLVRNSQRNINETTARMILQDIKVFAVNDVVGVENEKDSKDAKSVTAATISLLVTPDQAAKITLASEMGNIRLVMRGPDDDNQLAETEARPDHLFGLAQGSVRAKESLVEDEKPAAPKPNLLTDLLSAVKNPKPAQSGATDTAVESWTVRIIQPGTVNDVVLQRAKKTGSADDSSDTSHWSTATQPNNVRPRDGSDTVPAAAPQSAEPAKAAPETPTPPDATEKAA